MPKEFKMFVMKIVAKVANASKKKRKLNNIHEEGIHTKGVETNTTQSGIEGKTCLLSKEEEKKKLFKLMD